MMLPPPGSTLFPYTTLFRSELGIVLDDEQVVDGSSRSGPSYIGIARGGTRGARTFRSSQHRARRARTEERSQVPDPLAEQLLRSEEHTSELQSQSNLVCRLL